MTYAPVRPPLRFLVPPGWPEPSPAWVARNQGWQPPLGRLPPLAEGWPRVAPAKQGWQYWAPEPAAWQSFREPFVRAAKKQVLIGSLTFGIGAVITILGYLGDLGSTFLVLWGAIIFGFIRLVSGLANLRKADQLARTALTSRAQQVRREQDAAAYPHYLAETAAERAATGRPAMTLEQFSSAMDAEPWGSAALGQRPVYPGSSVASPGLPSGAASFAQAPVYGGAPGSGGAPAYASAPAYAALGASPTSPWTQVGAFQSPATRIPRRFRILIGVIVGLIVVVVAVVGFSHGSNASTSNGASSASSTRQWPSHIGNYDFSGLKYDIVDQGSCSSTAGCVQIDITPVTSCSAATFTWGFSDSKTGSDKAARTTAVALIAGQKAHVSIPLNSQLAPLDYVFLDSVDCA